MKKVLFCASRSSHIRNFHLPYLHAFKARGYEVWVFVGDNEEIPFADHVITLPLIKSMWSISNIRAIFLARKWLKTCKYDVISANTALAGVAVRLALMLTGETPQVFYIVHGFFFRETDRVKKWMGLLSEKLCKPKTDIMMVMNNEDKEIAEKYKLYGKKLYFIPGMGVNFPHVPPAEKSVREKVKKVFGIPEDAFTFVFAGEFLKRKNQELLIRAFSVIGKKHPDTRLVLAGEGVMEENCKHLAMELDIWEQVLFLGYVTDIPGLYLSCDVCVAPSLLEGLPFNVIEAMLSGLIVLANDSKGNRDLIKDRKTGFLFSGAEDLVEKMEYMLEHFEELSPIRKNAQKQAQIYKLENAFPTVMKVYDENLF